MAIFYPDQVNKYNKPPENMFKWQRVFTNENSLFHLPAACAACIMHLYPEHSRNAVVSRIQYSI
jgi:hypothetical protein